jgi:hypothetical protein
VRILVWGIEQDLKVAVDKASYLLDTANHFNIDVELVGIGHTFTTFKDRLYLLQDYLTNIDPNEVILVMDGYDTLFNSDIESALNAFLSKNTRILISAERMFTYQYPMYLDKYNEIESDYRYINAGTFIGYASDINQMLTELFELPLISQIDQGLMGAWLYNILDQPTKAQLDINCDIFWVTSGDWDKLKEIAEGKNPIKNPFTNTRPFVIHNTGNADTNLRQSYEAAYKNIVDF